MRLEGNAVPKYTSFFLLVSAFIFLNPFHRGILGLMVLSVYIVAMIPNKRITNAILNDIGFWVLLSFDLLTSILQLSYQFINNKTFVDYLTYPLILYIFGLIFVGRIKEKKRIMYFFYVVIIGFAIVGISTVLYTTHFYGSTFDGFNSRVGLNPLFGDTKISATGVGIYVSLGIALSGVLFIKTTNILLKGLNALIFLLSLYASLAFADRTGLIVAVLSVVSVYVIQMRLNSARKNVKTASLYIFIAIALIFLFNINLFNLKTMWLESSAFQRLTGMSLTNDPRFTAWGEAFKGMFSYPLGGKQARLNLDYAHNLWLDVGWTTGVFPFLLLLVFSLRTIRGYFKILRNQDLSSYLKYLLTAILCGFFLTFMVEPVMEANVLFFCGFCFISGIISSLSKGDANPPVCVSRQPLAVPLEEDPL